MNNPSDHDQTVSQLGQSLAQTAESGRALVEEMTLFAKDESLRFVNLRLERNGAALDRLQNCQGIPGLIGVQQEWLRDLLQDYTGQSMRWMGALRGLDPERDGEGHRKRRRWILIACSMKPAKWCSRPRSTSATSFRIRTTTTSSIDG